MYLGCTVIAHTLSVPVVLLFFFLLHHIWLLISFCVQSTTTEGKRIGLLGSAATELHISEHFIPVFLWPLSGLFFCSEFIGWSDHDCTCLVSWTRSYAAINFFTVVIGIIKYGAGHFLGTNPCYHRATTWRKTEDLETDKLAVGEAPGCTDHGVHTFCLCAVIICPAFHKPLIHRNPASEP